MGPLVVNIHILNKCTNCCIANSKKHFKSFWFLILFYFKFFDIVGPLQDANAFWGVMPWKSLGTHGLLGLIYHLAVLPSCLCSPRLSVSPCSPSLTMTSHATQLRLELVNVYLWNFRAARKTDHYEGDYWNPAEVQYNAAWLSLRCHTKCFLICLTVLDDTSSLCCKC